MMFSHGTNNISRGKKRQGKKKEVIQALKDDIKNMQVNIRENEIQEKEKKMIYTRKRRRKR